MAMKRNGKYHVSSDSDEKVMFFKVVSLGPHETQLRFRLIHFWEARNPVKKTLIGLEMLLIDEQIPISFDEDRFRFHSYKDFEANCDLKGDLYDVVGHMKLVDGQTLIERPSLDEVKIATTRHIMVHVQSHEIRRGIRFSSPLPLHSHRLYLFVFSDQRAEKPRFNRATSPQSIPPVSSDSDEKVMFFKDVSLGPHETQLRSRLIHFWEARNPMKKNLIGLEMLLIDEQGTVIQGFIPPGRIKKYLREMKHGSIPISFDEDRFRFHSYEDFEANCDLKGDLYDVVGHMKLVDGQTLIERPRLDDVKIATTRHIMIHVQSHDGSVMKLYLWDQAATDFCKKFNSCENTPTVLLVTTVNTKRLGESKKPIQLGGKQIKLWRPIRHLDSIVRVCVRTQAKTANQTWLSFESNLSLNRDRDRERDFIGLFGLSGRRLSGERYGYQSHPK
ncbi:hypothetical protein DY000_02030518 [Brassica cretica]|uniref:DUF223 domain-containing protein n=1 Tax=Brassica cretica TaxID=69181 RepID=A0ABQ7DKA1_BRACR|nr:hypothetical protein DY000_02030518 [Brassica cretica]